MLISEDKKKALFLDRDGVINHDRGYVYTPQKCIFNNNILDLLKKQKNHYLIIVITNQSGIGRGYFTEEEFHDFMSWINDKLEGLIDDYYFVHFMKNLELKIQN